MDIQAIKEVVVGWLPTISGVSAIIVATANLINKFSNSAKRLRDEVVTVVSKHEVDMKQIVKSNFELQKENDFLKSSLLQALEKLNAGVTAVQTLPEATKQVIEDAIYDHFEKEAIKVRAIEEALKKAGIPYDQIEENITTN